MRDPTSMLTAGSSHRARKARVVSNRMSLVRKTAPAEGSEQPVGMSRWWSGVGETRLGSHGGVPSSERDGATAEAVSDAVPED